MKIIYYCQHVLGIGHLHRSLEICRKLAGHDITFVSGGAPVQIPLPAQVRLFQLPALMMDHQFKGLHATTADDPIETIRSQRRERLQQLFHETRPDLFLVELYPFGRKAFRFELDPVLEANRKQSRPAKVICSLRDILVEKDDWQAYQKRVIATLNRFFDGLLIHSDPKVIRLAETFPEFDEIKPAVYYTGFVAVTPPLDALTEIRSRLGLADQDPLVVASVGGGNVGGQLLSAVARAISRLPEAQRPYLQIFTGPYVPEDLLDTLQGLAGNRIRVAKYTSRFISWLAAADLSISMAGYNTCMNILATGVSALVWPFAHNREQGLRAERLAALGAVKVLTDDHLQSDQLGTIILKKLRDRSLCPTSIDLDGAARSARIIASIGNRL